VRSGLRRQGPVLLLDRPCASFPAVDTPEVPSKHERHQQASSSEHDHVRDVADMKDANVRDESISDYSVQRAHSTFTSGADCPLPGGEANGVGMYLRFDWTADEIDGGGADGNRTRCPC
jgi:hypothetical protein